MPQDSKSPNSSEPAPTSSSELCSSNNSHSKSNFLDLATLALSSTRSTFSTTSFGVGTSTNTETDAELEESEYCLSNLNQRSTLLFSSRRQLFHQLDEGLRSLQALDVDLDWISNNNFKLDSVHAAGYDLFFLDIGFFTTKRNEEKLRQISELAAHPSTPPIILISDKNSLRVTLNALGCGVVDYLFRDEIDSTLLIRMLQYAESSDSGKNEIFDRRRLPNQQSISSALEYSLLEDSAENGRSKGDTHTIPLNPATVGWNAPGSKFSPWRRGNDDSLLNMLPFPSARCAKDGTLLFGSNLFEELFASRNPLARANLRTRCAELASNSQGQASRQSKKPIGISRVQLETAKGRGWFDISVSVVSVQGEFLVFFQNVTEHIRTQEALKVSESRLRTILRQLPVAVWTIDSDLRLYLSNTAVWLPERLRNNRTPGALSLHDLFESEDPEYQPISLARRALLGESVSMQILIGGVEYLIQLEPTRDATGRIIGAVGVTVNMSERLALQQQLVENDKFESLAALARGIAHDFNNLLVGIVGNAGLISLELPQDSTARTRLTKITRAAECASDFTSQLLAYSGKSSTHREEVQLSEIATEMLELLEDTFSSRIEVLNNCREDLPSISADATQVRQVAMNLIKNAADALGQKGGQIKINTQIKSPESALDSSKPTHVCLSVADTGPGIDEKTKRRIFDPFFSTKSAGRGLGLSTVLGIVKTHRASIEVESIPNEGSTFLVFFPIR